MTEEEIVKLIKQHEAFMSYHFGIIGGHLHIISKKLQLLLEKERDNDPLEQINKMAQTDKGA
jgi:hypothetical protein